MNVSKFRAISITIAVATSSGDRKRNFNPFKMPEALLVKIT